MGKSKEGKEEGPTEMRLLWRLIEARKHNWGRIERMVGTWRAQTRKRWTVENGI
jgi:hypothetical protein